jgi:hypothetical protein
MVKNPNESRQTSQQVISQSCFAHIAKWIIIRKIDVSKSKKILQIFLKSQNLQKMTIHKIQYICG